MFSWPFLELDFASRDRQTPRDHRRFRSPDGHHRAPGQVGLKPSPDSQFLRRRPRRPFHDVHGHNQGQLWGGSSKFHQLCEPAARGWGPSLDRWLLFCQGNPGFLYLFYSKWVLNIAHARCEATMLSIVSLGSFFYGRNYSARFTFPFVPKRSCSNVKILTNEWFQMDSQCTVSRANKWLNYERNNKQTL